MSSNATILRARGWQGVDRQADPAAYWGIRLAIASVLVWGASFAIGFAAGLTILVIIAWASAIVGLRYPVLGMFGIGMLCALDPMERVYLLTGGLLRWNTMNYWLLLVMVLSMRFILRLDDLPSRLFQLLILLLGIELFVGTELTGGVQDLLAIVVLLGILRYFATAVSDVKTLYWLSIVLATTTAAGSMAFFPRVASLPPINPNASSFLPLTGLFAICIAFPFISNNLRTQGVLVALSAVNFIGVFLSASRGNLLIAMCCLLFIFMKIPGVSRRSLILIAAVLGGFWISIQFSDLTAHTLHRLDRSFNSDVSLASRSSGRSNLVIVGWYIFRDHPFGVGTGGFGAAYANLPILDGLTGFPHGEAVDSHSAWIKVLAENGIPGIVLLGGYVLSFTLVGWRKRQNNLFALGVLVTACLGLGFLSTEYQNKGLWFLSAGVTAVFYREEFTERLRDISSSRLGKRVHESL